MPTKDLQKEGKAIAKKLAKSGLTGTLRVEFSGSGDEGSIQDVAGIDHKHPLFKEFEGWADNFADDMPVDWVNNDGGQGWIEVDLETLEITYEVSYNEMVSHTAEEGKF